jgi:hypothetical protein
MQRKAAEEELRQRVLLLGLCVKQERIAERTRAFCFAFDANDAGIEGA